MAAETPRKTNWTFVEKFTSCRWVLAYMLFVLRMFQTALRQSIGMALVCMAERPVSEPGDGLAYNASSVGKPSDVSRAISDVLIDRNQTMLNISSFSAVDNSHRREFVWDATFEGVVLSSYYYGYMVTPLISSYTERLVGAKWLVASCLGVGAVVNLFTPELTRVNKYLLVALRVVAGTTNGMIDPAIQSLWSVWGPKSEIAYLAAVEYAGVSVAGIFTFLISGLLCEIPVDNGWPLVFYFYGSTGAIWLILWFALVFNRPSEHPRISPKELKYISEETHSYLNTKKKIHPPWLKMLASPAVWAIVIATSTFTWVYSWVLCYLPMYMQDVLRYNIAQNAMLSSLPFVGKFATGLICGYLADRLLRTSLSVSRNRKIFQMIGAVGCACCTVIIGFLDHSSRDLAVVLLVMAVAAQNISTASFRINALDIAPRYSGFILALANTVAVAMSMTAPLVTSAVVYEGNREQWQTMFYVVAALSLAGGVAFMCLAKAKLQDWACDHQDDIKVGDDKAWTSAFIGHDSNGHNGNHVDPLTSEDRQHKPAEKV